MDKLVFDPTNPEHLAKRAFAAWNFGKGDTYLIQAVKDVKSAVLACAANPPAEAPKFTTLLLKWSVTYNDAFLFLGVRLLEQEPYAHVYEPVDA